MSETDQPAGIQTLYEVSFRRQVVVDADDRIGKVQHFVEYRTTQGVMDEQEVVLGTVVARRSV